MPVTAKLNNLRIAPRKVRLVADLIRGKKLEEAQTILNFTRRAASLPLYKLLKQAEANAKNNFQLDPANLQISRITVDEGPKMKRWMPRARGQAYEIQKKTSHIIVILEEIVKKQKKARKTKQKAVQKEAVPEQREKKFKEERPKFRPEIKDARPKTEKGIQRIFRRKAF